MQDLTDRELLTRVERAAAERAEEDWAEAEAAREAAEAERQAAEQARRDDAMRTVEGALADARAAAAALVACAEEWRRNVDVLRQARGTVIRTLQPFANEHQRVTLDCLTDLAKAQELAATLRDPGDSTLATLVEGRAASITELAARVLEPPAPESTEDV